MVHDQLSQGFDETVDFDTIAQRGLNAVVEVSANGAPVHTVTQGSFGRLRAEDATSLAMIMSELVQNAIEHGLGAAGGEVRIGIERAAGARARGSGPRSSSRSSATSRAASRGSRSSRTAPGPGSPPDCAPSPDGVPCGPTSRATPRHTPAAKSPATVTVTGLADGGRAGPRRP